MTVGLLSGSDVLLLLPVASGGTGMATVDTTMPTISWTALATWYTNGAFSFSRLGKVCQFALSLSCGAAYAAGWKGSTQHRIIGH